MLSHIRSTRGTKKSDHWLSSLVNFKPVYFFFFFITKRFRAHKNTHKQTLTNKTKLSKHEITKTTIFCAHKFLRGLKALVLRFSGFSACETLNRRKKNKQTWNCLDNLILLYFFWGAKYLLCVIDVSTKHALVKPLKDKKC